MITCKRMLLNPLLLGGVLAATMCSAVSLAGEGNLGGAMLLQAMQTRQSSSVPFNGSFWNGAVVDEMGEALMQQLQSHPNADHYGALLKVQQTPPPPPPASVWKSPLQNMPVVTHKKAEKMDDATANLKEPSEKSSEVDQSSVVIPGTIDDATAGASQSPAEGRSSVGKLDREQVSEDTLQSEEEFQKSVNKSANATRKVRIGSPMQARTAIREHITGCKHGVTDEGHHSIFKLPFQDLDSLLFWVIFSGMLLFTIIIDRCENSLTRLAANSKTETMLLQRINAELMMFGIVGLGVFIGTNIVSDIPAEFFRVFEFTDILCSLGACGLIGIASVLFILRRVMERRWTVLEASLEVTQDLVVGTNASKDVKLLADQTTLRQKEYFVMSRKFIRQQKIPPGFVYCDYLQECLAQNVCNLMNINSLSWAFLLLIAVGGLIFKAYSTQSFTNNEHLQAFIVVVWSTLGCFLYLMWEVNTARSSLRRHLDIKYSLGQDLANGEVERHPDHPKDKAWSWRINQLMQSLALFTAFQGAFYVMHMDYNIRLNAFHWGWRAAMLCPIMLNLFFMLPMIISRFTLVEAYFTPEHDAVDEVLTKMKQHDEDLRYFYTSWIHSGRPAFIDPGMHITFTEFSRVLKRHGMQASQARRKRLFDNLDAEQAGVIDVMKLLDELTALDDREQAFSQINDVTTPKG